MQKMYLPGYKACVSLGLLALCLLLLCSCIDDHGSSAERPNILLILADDMGYGDVSNMGNPHLRTPHLDRLARESVHFSNFYVSPVCAPTRASLLTGRYHQRTGVQSVTNGYEMMDPEETTLAEYLQAAGYRTGLFGKWHLGEHYPSLPNAQGFDEFLGFRTGHTGQYKNPLLEHNGQQVQKQGYITTVLTDEAASFMLAGDGQPFFCYLAYNAPHTPLHIDSSYWQPYAQQGLDERTARVYGMIENLDENVGRLLQQLESNQLRRETIVIFLSDNGPISGWRVAQEKMRYNAGLRDQKFSIYEGGMRTQAYWSWPEHWAADREVSSPAAHIDVLPTLLDVAGVPLTATAHQPDGISLKKLLAGEQAATVDRTLFQHYDVDGLERPVPFPGGIVRWKNWKMVNGDALYDLASDPGETRNFAADEPAILQQLNKAYQQWWNDINTNSRLKPAPIPVGHPKADTVFLTPHYGRVEGGLVFLGQRGLLGEQIGRHPRGVDGDWLSHWQQKGAQINWSVKAATGGLYEFGILARDTIATEQLEWRFQMGEKQREGSISPDETAADWAYLPLGEIELEAGVYPLQLSLQNEVANQLEVKGVLLIKK